MYRNFLFSNFIFLVSISTIGKIGYLGFVAQIPWTMVQVYLPVLNMVCGGEVFSFAVGIAMGISCNLSRLSVILFAQSSQFRIRILIGVTCSFIFVTGYFFIHLFGFGDWPFWLGLVMAFFGGIGNAQLMGTGYGLASMCESPLGSTLFFFGQAIAAILCWPIKCLVEQIFGNPLGQLGIGMAVPAFFLVSILFVRQGEISLAVETKPERFVPKSWKEIKHVLTMAVVPLVCLWILYSSTGLVTPGQVIHWPPPQGDVVSTWYKSICTYTLLLSEALGKSIPMIVSIKGDRMKQFLKTKVAIRLVMIAMIVRIGLVPFFYIPPNSNWLRFPMLVVFGLLGGCAASVAISVAAAIPNDARNDLVGYLTSFAIINGLFIGAITSFFISQISYAIFFPNNINLKF